MELTIQTFLIVCPLVFLAGLVDSIAGGGGLISLPAYLLAGVPMHNAIATNKYPRQLGQRFQQHVYVRINLWTGELHCHVFPWLLSVLLQALILRFLPVIRY